MTARSKRIVFESPEISINLTSFKYEAPATISPCCAILPFAITILDGAKTSRPSILQFFPFAAVFNQRSRLSLSSLPETLKPSSSD